MKKATLILSLVLVMGMFAFGSITPGQAWASNDGQPELAPPEDGDDIVYEQSDGNNDGSDGDPDSAGDGFGFMGQGIFDGLEDIISLTYEEIVEMLLAQMIPVP